MKLFYILTMIVLMLTACSPAGDESVHSAKQNTPPNQPVAGDTDRGDETTRLANGAHAQIADGSHYTYLIVHGASGGGWDWRTMDDLLTADGHKVYRPTLTGLGEKTHLNSPEINLTTHINDIANVILFENLHDVVLVGHSYGGVVITGVMDRMPERIRHAIFLDAGAPEDGMSAEDLWGSITSSHKIEDGIVYFSWLDPGSSVPRDVPQSLKTLTEPVSFDNPAALDLPVTFIAYIHPGQTTEERATDPSWQNASARKWTIRTLESDHNAQRSHPEELAALLEAAPDDRNQP